VHFCEKLTHILADYLFQCFCTAHTCIPYVIAYLGNIKHNELNGISYFVALEFLVLIIEDFLKNANAFCSPKVGSMVNA
jgi:hypothetical protein